MSFVRLDKLINISTKAEEVEEIKFYDPNSRGDGGGGRGVLKKINTGRLRQEVQPLTLLYTIFGRKDTPFVYLPLTNDAPPFRIPSTGKWYPFTYKLKQYSHKVCMFEIF